MAKAARRRAGALAARRALVAQGVLAGKPIRLIAAELAALPVAARPPDCSVATIGRDALALREAWAAARQELVEGLLSAELARLEALHAAWWPKALATNAVATDRVLAVQRQRLALLQPGLARRTTGATAAAGVADDGDEEGKAVRVVVEFVEG